MGNLDAARDWGHAIDYVEAMWLILQQDKPDDFVCATDISHTVNDLIDYTFSKLEIDRNKFIMQDENFFRPEELNILKGDPTKLKNKTGWNPKYNFYDMMDEMINYWLLSYK